MNIYLMNNDYEVVINYFLKNNLEKDGYLKFKELKVLMKKCFKQLTDYQARKIFNIIDSLDYFEKRRLEGFKKHYEYKFKNPYVKEEKPTKFVISFD